MKLQHRGRHFFSDRPLHGGSYSIGFALAVGQKHNTAAPHNALDSHGKCLPGNVFFPLEEAGIGLDSCRREFYQASNTAKRCAWLIETDVGIAADPQNLQIDAACGGNLVFVSPALLFWIRSRAVG